MEPIFFFKNMSPADEEQMREYVAKKLPKIEKMLSRFSSDSVILQVKGERFQKHSAYEVEMVMKMPGETLSACEASHMITKAVDLAKDRLDMQLKKKLLLVRRSHRSIKARSKMKLRAAEAVQ